MKYSLFILALLFAGFSFESNAQKSKKEKQEVNSQSVKAVVEGGKFIFKAQSATPSRGGVIQLTSGYEMSVSPEEIKSELPYFGRSFSGGYGGSESGITFTSNKFEYDVKPKKKGGWDVTIKPTDTSQISKLFLSITSTGQATLRVTSTDRDSISYYGVIE